MVAGATLAGIMAIGIAGFFAARSKRQARPAH
jgi:LPXTG-motif cell wall-anchored protein